MSSLPKPLGQPWSDIILPQKGDGFPEQWGKNFPIRFFPSRKPATSDARHCPNTEKSKIINHYEDRTHSCANLSLASGHGGSRNS